MFVDPERGDYGVKEGSPALELGFVNFPMDQFGVVSPDLKKIARTPLAAVATAPMESGDQRVMHWLGAEVKSLTTLGEVSATGLGRPAGILVVRVPPDSEAANAGLLSNDVILKINATAVAGWDEFFSEWKAVSGAGLVQLDVWRDQKECSVEVGPSR